ncbi:hypothetical protein GCM10023331_06620 [Algivirga pacifica]|uniref:Uncharacterized protein n=1 Tax=Algivirga pacifica TaxID=1162670 RepID=A0ABP9D6F3_9BACT
MRCNIRIIMTILSCLVQIVLIKLDTSSEELSYRKIITPVIMVHGNEQIVPNKKSYHLFLKENCNISKQATL